MFSTGSVEKNSSNLVEPHSPGRSKFPVGLNQLGDESQQNNRIQTAVHRYNNPTVGSFARSVNERSIPSPFRQAFLKNGQKYKNFEGDEEAHNGTKKSHNYYQGVGNFPVVHLKKNEIITRPIRRMMNNEFKIQLPELPYNRFLNHSPDICLDTKTSTRSVLDVLQDLSRKRIHTKDDNEGTKRKFKGLGGDAPLDIEAPYKPLFVPKTKTSSVTLRDNTTQTQDLPLVELSPSKKNDKILNNKKDDPKAELRRKLARQNNEIFASLSSSTLTYPLKRNSGKISQDKDDTKQSEQNLKKVKYFLEDKNDKKLQNGDISSKDIHAYSNGDGGTKIEKRNKAIVDTKLSPNKDRLTTIFLEMQNVNPRAQVWTNNQSSNTTESVEQTKTLLTDKPIEEKSVSSENKNDITEKSGNNSEVGSTSSISMTTPNFSNSYDTNKIPNIFNNVDNGNKDILVSEKNNLSTCVVTSSSIISTTTTVNYGIPSTSPAVKLPIASTVPSSITSTPILSTGISQKEDSSSSGNGTISKITEPPKSDAAVGSEQNSPNQKSLFQPPTSGSGFNFTQGIGQQTAGAGLFKFGTGVNTSPNQISQSENKLTSNGPKEEENNALGVTNTTSTSLTGFSTGISGQPLFTVNTATTTTATSTESQKNVPSFSFSDKSVGSNQNEEKPVFQFGFNPSAASSSMPSSLFSTGMPGTKAEDKREQTPESKDTPKPETSNANTTTPSFLPSTFSKNPFSASVPTFGLSANTSAQNTMPFKFGEKTETDKPNNETPSSGTNFFDQKKPGLFTFGQKPQVSEPPASQPNLFQQSTFTFGQSTSTPSSTPLQTSTSSNLFGQTTTPQTNIFQSTSTTTANPVMNSTSPFGVNSQASDSLNKPQVPSFIPTTSTPSGIMNNTFTQNKLSVPAFGQSTPTFGQIPATNFSGEKNVFGASTSQTPAFGSAPAGQAGPFSSTFGDSNKQENAPNPTSNFFSQPPATQTSTFPSSTGFGTSAFGQTPSAKTNIFGQKTGFEQNQNQATPFSTTQPFTSQTGFNFGAATTTTASTGFAMSTPNTSAPVFAFGNAAKTTPSTAFGFTGSSQPESSSQSLFSFNSQTQPNTFKFGDTTPKETTPFGSAGSVSSTFTFNATPSTSDAAKPAGSVFNFGGSQTSTANTGFNFNANQSPVFSFGGSSSSSSSSKFTFGATPTGGNIFTPGATPSPSTVPPLQGVFSIGSGSSQPRSRSSVARARRRP